ncbi:MAG: PaaI family thioesterase [Treponemataceae bacterium]
MSGKVVKKQENASHCFVCGLKNDFGLKAEFYEIEKGEIRALFTPCEMHQGYPGRLHGGLAASVLDETIGRAINAGREDGLWGVTVELSLKYRKPVPLGVPLTVTGRVTKDGGRVYEGSGEILLADGSVAVEASGRYMKLTLDRIAESISDDIEWKVVPKADDPVAFSL